MREKNSIPHVIAKFDFAVSLLQFRRESEFITVKIDSTPDVLCPFFLGPYRVRFLIVTSNEKVNCFYVYLIV